MREERRVTLGPSFNFGGNHGKRRLGRGCGEGEWKEGREGQRVVSIQPSRVRDSPLLLLSFSCRLPV